MQPADAFSERPRFWSLLKSAINGEQKDFTTGSVRRALFMLSVPMVLEMAMESLFAVVDVFYVSRVSVEAVATVGLTESVMMLVFAIAIGLSMAATAFVARRVGEKNFEKAAEAGGQAIILAGAISVVLGLVGVIFAEEILRLMGATDAVVREGLNYTRIMLGGNIVIVYLFLNNAIFRGAGDAAIAMRVLWFANLLNIALGPIFIFGLGPIPALGVTGAAIATTIGRGLGVLYQFRVLASDKSLVRIRFGSLRPDYKILREMFGVSLGGMSQFLIHSASWIFLVRILAGFGSAAVAGYTIAIRVIIFSILPSWGLANAAATLVGQNLGAQKPDRAEQSVWTAGFYNMVFLTSLSVIFFTFAYPILGIFSTDPLVIDSGIRCLRIICVGYILFAYGMVISQAFNGAGDTKTPTYMNLVCFWAFQIPLAWILAQTTNLGPSAVYTAQSASFCLEAIMGFCLFRRGKWKQVKI